MSNLLTGEDILEADDLETRDIEVPEWGGTVRVRGLTGEERDRFESELAEATPDSKVVEVRGQKQRMNMVNARAKLVARCCIDENGERLFSDTQISELAKKSGRALDRVYEVAQELSGITEEELEEITENLDGTPSANSTSD